MKFGKWLKRQIEQSLPAWRPEFLRYKELKAVVSAVPGRRAPSPPEFVALLDAEVEKISAFFVEQEEEFIIRHRELQEEMMARSAVGMGTAEAAVRREMVNFHGEMVLLLNYSGINYVGLAKILKKYDKRTGASLRLPVMETVLGQPFFATETVSQMVRDCEAMMEAAFPAAAAHGDAQSETAAAVAMAAHGEAQSETGTAAGRWDREDLAGAEQSIFRNTVAALLAMEDVRGGSSTRGRHSLPPLSLPNSDWLRSFQPQLPIPIQ